MKNNKQTQPVARIQPIRNHVGSPLPSNDDISRCVADYKRAVSNWETKTNNYWKARNSANENGNAFICVEPPSKPKLEDFI